MNPARFDLLDHLHTIDADSRWVNREDLANTWNISSDAAHSRMMRLEADGLAMIRRHERVNANTYPPPDYRLTGHGSALYRAELARMAGETGPPRLDESVAHASLATHALTHYGTEAA